jgi:hypothetical protein
MRSEISNKSILLSTLAALLVIAGMMKLASVLSTNDIVASAVMITNNSGNHGGTGVILRSNRSKSEILTNSHVCKVVEQGGLVTTKTGSYAVTSYKHSKLHDICLITVNADLGVNTPVAKRAPVLYYEAASISGHPALLPNIVTNGHFSGKRIISVMIGVKQCTESELQDPRLGLPCILMGGLPIIKRYESTLVSATIMPGSSGSGVFNASQQLAGLAFAGSGDLGYAWTVPFEALKNFLNREQYELPDIVPSDEVDLSAGQESGRPRKFNEIEVMANIYSLCSLDTPSLKEICKSISGDMVYRGK